MRLVRILSMCSVVVLGCVLTYRKVCEEHSLFKMRASSQGIQNRINRRNDYQVHLGDQDRKTHRDSV